MSNWYESQQPATGELNPDIPQNASLPDELYTPIVARYLRIQDTTWGEAKSGFIVRYRGNLYNDDSAAAYDQLAANLRTFDITPLFRTEAGLHTIVLIKGVVKPKPSKSWVPILLLALTVLSVLFAGTLYSYNGPPASSVGEAIRNILANLSQGIPFAVGLLSILLAHEFGHYLAGRFHRTAVTLPYFIPFPLSYFGTMGAFIQLKEPPKNRRILLDIGIAGPLAGLVVAIPVLLIGLSLSTIEPIPYRIPAGQGFEGNSILYLVLKYVVTGLWLPEPVTYNGISPVLYWIRYLFTGTPLPRGGLDVILHPLAWAGWAGLLVTALNLIPAGQLDGGHLIYVLIGRRASRLLPFILGALILLGMVWSGWWLWAFLIFLLGRLYAEPLDQITTLDPRRKAVAVLGLVIFLLVFVPVPLIEVLGSA